MSYCSQDPSDSGTMKQEQGCCDRFCVQAAAEIDCVEACHIDETASKETQGKEVLDSTVDSHSQQRPGGGSTAKDSGCASGEIGRDIDGKRPCEKHFKAAYERYSTILETVGCICETLLARNLESCCSSIRNRKKRASGLYAPREKTSNGSLRSASSTSCSNGACTGCERRRVNTGPCRATIGACRSTNSASDKDNICREKCNDTCHANSDPCKSRIGLCKKEICPEQSTDDCGKEGHCCEARTDACVKGSYLGLASLKPSAPKQNSCCKAEDDSEMAIAPCGKRESFGKGCCDEADSPCRSGKANIEILSGPDIEKGPAILEQVTLSVEGMTCVGCETKLSRSLDAISWISDVKTSFVMSQAEFTIDINAKSVGDVVVEVTKATGFACHRIKTTGQSLDFLVPGFAKDFVRRKKPYWVESLTVIDNRTVRVLYDAKFIGAREVLASFSDDNISLAPPRPSTELESGAKHVRSMFLLTCFSAFLTIPVLILAWAPLSQHELLYGIISLVLATIVQVFVARPFYSSALRALLFTRVIEMDLLIVLSTSTAYIYSIIAFVYQVRGHPLATGEFFETSTLLVTLIMVGRLLGAFARHKAVESSSIRSLQSNRAILVNSDKQNDQEIDARLLQYGDIFKVLPDSRIPTDGTVIAGQSEVDESNVTGEAVPVEKAPGSKVIAGCLNGAGTLLVRLTRLPGENTISEIAAMADAAKFSKPKIQNLADRVVSDFVPVVIFLTLITFGVWIAVGIANQHKSRGAAAVQAMTRAIAVLIVSCPCAIGLAVPMVVVIAGGVGAKHGIVIKSAETLETARKVSHVVLDKTGTLTQGTLSVSAEEYLSTSEPAAASIALGLTINSRHPVSAAVAAHLQAQGIKPSSVENVRSVTGRGMEGTFEGVNVRGGNCSWLAARDTPQVKSILSRGVTVFCLSLGGKVLAVWGLEDPLRSDAISVISKLRERDIAVSLVSGDDDGAVQKVGRQLGIPSSHIRSRCSPSDKQNYLREIKEREKGMVLFCGDGTNDAPALVQADIGVHMAGGTDIAQSSADAVLVRPTLSGLLVLIDLSQAAFRRIVFNFVWSFLYNTFAILLAAEAFVHARIPPQYAGLGELVSVLPVILIALQLRWFES